MSIATESVHLLKQPGVYVLRTATKMKGGVDTGEPCLQIAVEKKRPLAEIPESELLPSQVNGMKTDVVEATMPRAISDHTARSRPVIGGVSGFINQSGMVGTIGAVVVDNTTKRLAALTNNHCSGLLYDPEYSIPTSGHLSVDGIQFLQPAPGDGGTSSDIIGSVIRAHALRFGSSAPANSIDAAIISLDDIDAGWFGILDAHIGPYPFAELSDLSTGQTVQKSGRSTGVTQGTIEDLSAAANITYFGSGVSDIAAFSGQMLISGDGIAAAGDSGATVLVIADGTICIAGLLFATYSSVGQDYAICNHISEVALTLNISSWGGEVVLPRSTSNAVMVNDATFVRSGDTTLPITHHAEG